MRSQMYTVRSKIVKSLRELFLDFHVVSEFWTLLYISAHIYMCVCVYLCMMGSENSLNIQDQEGVGLLSVYLAVVEQNLPTAHNHVL